MKTVLTTSFHEAAEFIKLGGIVAFPTETVYGLGANVFDESAIEKIFAAKRRPADNPLIAHVAEITEITQLVSQITSIAEKFIRTLFPAPLTLVLPKSERVPLVATAGLDSIGIRMPNHKLALQFLKECGVPLVAPSANLSGKPSPTTWQAVAEDLNGRIDCILQGEQTNVGLESTVVDCTTETPMILRVGAVTLEQLRKIAPEIEIADYSSKYMARSPGTRYKHYAPEAKVVLVNSLDEIGSAENSAFIGLEAPKQLFKQQKVCSSIEEYAHSIFAFFRQADEMEIRIIYCQTVPESNFGLALMDRLRRAAN